VDLALAAPAGPAKNGAKSDAPAAKTAQHEFGFGEVERRGHFEKTDRNLFDGQDLDVPTYLRKGIKINLGNA
jgi:cell division protein FtsZ